MANLAAQSIWVRAFTKEGDVGRWNSCHCSEYLRFLFRVLLVSVSAGFAHPTYFQVLEQEDPVIRGVIGGANKLVFELIYAM
jgi:hypothetical protein